MSESPNSTDDTADDQLATRRSWLERCIGWIGACVVGMVCAVGAKMKDARKAKGGLKPAVSPAVARSAYQNTKKWLDQREQEEADARLKPASRPRANPSGW